MADSRELGIGLVGRNYVAICKMTKVRLDTRLHASVQRDLIDRHRGQAGGRSQRSARAAADLGREATQEAVEAREAVDVLTENGKKTDSMVQLISESAEHTNLLTLNVTIEASRACDAGRGFSVVRTGGQVARKLNREGDGGGRRAGRRHAIRATRSLPDRRRPRPGGRGLLFGQYRLGHRPC
jgi:Methyl-accepting chemotaxis protein (MCP) signalling domain